MWKHLCPISHKVRYTNLLSVLILIPYSTCHQYLALDSCRSVEEYSSVYNFCVFRIYCCKSSDLRSFLCTVISAYCIVHRTLLVAYTLSFSVNTTPPSPLPPPFSQGADPVSQLISYSWTNLCGYIQYCAVENHPCQIPWTTPSKERTTRSLPRHLCRKSLLTNNTRSLIAYSWHSAATEPASSMIGLKLGGGGGRGGGWFRWCTKVLL